MSRMILAPRDYQLKMIESVEDAWRGGLKRPAGVLPTAGGKTVVFSHLAKRFIDANPRKRVLAIAHTSELVEQAAARMRDVAPGLPVGIVKAERNQTMARYVVASVQTLRNDLRRRQLHDVGVVIVDECHRAAAASYVTVLEHFGCFGAERAWRGNDAVALGVTATMVRGDRAALGDVWQDVVFTRSIAQMITDGWLVRPTGRRVRVDDLDLSRVKRSGGDYQDGALGEAISDSMAPELIAAAYREHCPDRSGIVFAPTVDSARVIMEALRGEGFKTEMVSGMTPAVERRRILNGFRDGTVQIVCNCAVLTEGFDAPRAEVVVIARPTTNHGLYLQMVGRVLRPFPGKTGALVLDVVGASQRHALTARIELFGEEDAEGITERELNDDDPDDESLDEGELTLDGLGDGEMVSTQYATGPLVSEEVDLFHGSGSAWLQTDGGIWFLAAGQRYIAIMRGEAPGTYDVVWMHQSEFASAWVQRGVGSLSYAMAWGEADVTSQERLSVDREGSWRKRRPTKPQVAQARRYGIEVSWPFGDVTAGELAGRISQAHATARIDPYIPHYAR